MKKTIIWILISLMMISLASAALTDELLAYYNFSGTGDLIDVVNSYDIPEIGTVASQTGIDGEARGSFTCANYFKDTSWIPSATENDNYTINIWAKEVTASSDFEYLWQASDNFEIASLRWSGGTPGMQALVEPAISVSGNDVTTGDWEMITVVFNGSDSGKANLYQNGAYVDRTANPDPYTRDNEIWVGCSSLGFEANQFYMDEMAYWNRTLSDSEVEDLYNSGTGFFYPFVTPQVNFSITAVENYFGANSINSFNSTLNSTTYGTTVGYINTTIANTNADLWNITMFAKGYLNRTYTDYNISLSGDLIGNLTRNETTLNITAYSFNGTKLQSYNITANSYNSTHSINTDTTTGILSLTNLRWNETYNISIDVPGYALSNNLADVTMDEFYKFQNFTNLYLNQTIIFNFFDETTNDPIENVTIELIGTSFSANYTTTPDNNLSVSLIIPDDYIIRYSATSYPERFNYFTLTERSFNNLTLYLVQGASNITATVLDENGDKVTGARIQVNKYDVTTNSYVLREEAETNFEGKTILHLFKNTEFYRFTVLDPENIVRLSTTPTYIFEDTITFQINLQDEIAQGFFDRDSIIYSLTYNQDTNNFKFTFTDPSGTLVTQACLDVDNTEGTRIVDYDEQCISSTSGTILINAPEVNGTTYEATATVFIAGEEIFLAKLVKNFQFFNTTGNMGLYLIALLTIVFGILGYVLGGASMSIIATPLPLLFGSIIGLGLIEIGIMLFVQVLAVVIAYVISR